MRLYDDLAYLWPIISPPAEYRSDAALWQEVILARLDPSRLGTGRRPSLLELGCGGGHLLSHLTSQFDTEAVDLSPKMLELSRSLNNNTVHHLGDMRDIRLGRRFDVVAIYDAVNYMLDENDLRAAMTTAVAHLNPGGLLLLAPDCLQDTFMGPRVTDWTRHDRQLDVTFIEYTADPDPADTTIESVFLFIINQEGKISVEQDRHTSGLFPKSTWLTLLKSAGFEPEYLDTEGYDGGIGGHLFVGTLQDDPAGTPAS
jgi:SAM-dependent methyltransferase